MDPDQVIKKSMYRSWLHMRFRCNNPNATGYENYGGRGIGICKRWNHFVLFLTDMWPKPPGTSLDRIDNDADYGPDNCRWATRKEQARNRRTTKLTADNIEFIRHMRDVVKLSFGQIAKAFKVTDECVRMAYHGKSWA